MTGADRLGGLLLDRFAGRTDCYLSERRGNVKEPPTTDVIAAHLSGQDRIGIFPNGHTRYLGFDFDGKNLAGGVDEAWKQLGKVAAVIDADLGLRSPAVELTRSGVGLRATVFFDPDDEPTVQEAKALGRSVLRAAGLHDDEDEERGHVGVYPHTPGPKGIGKTVFLPLGGILNGGVSRFLDAATREPLDRQEEPLEDPRLVTRAEVLAATATLGAAEAELRGAPATIQSPPTDSPVIDRPTGTSRHGALWNYAVRWARLGLGELEVRTFANVLAEDWGMLAEGRGGEVENLVVGAMLKAKRDSTETAELPYPADLYGAMFTPRHPAFDNTIIRRLGITLFWSAPGGLKTHFVQTLCHEMLCDTGRGRLFGHPGLWINRRWKRVLWIATEECGDELRYQAEQVLKGLGRDKLDGELHYLFAAAAGNRITLDDLPALIERDGPWDAIVLDSLTGLRPKTVNGVSVKWDLDNDAANEACLKLRGLAAKHQLCFLIVHHSGRDTTRYRGATDWWASADSMIGLTPDGGRVKVEVEKVRGGKKPGPFVLTPEWNADGSFTLVYSGVVGTVKFSPTAERMKAFTQGARSASQAELIAKVGCARSTGQTAIEALVAAGYLRATGTTRDRSPVYIYQEAPEVTEATTGQNDDEE